MPGSIVGSHRLTHAPQLPRSGNPALSRWVGRHVRFDSINCALESDGNARHSRSGPAICPHGRGQARAWGPPPALNARHPPAGSRLSCSGVRPLGPCKRGLAAATIAGLHC